MTRTLTIAAAADLQKAFTEIAPLFEKMSGAKVAFVFGSTGLLARQAAQNAPFDALFAANESYISELEKQGKTIPQTRSLYAVGRIVIWTRAGRQGAATLQMLAAARFRRIAIANPEHAPYGTAAREALRKAGVWNTIKQRIVYGDNVQQTMQYAATGNADAAIIALSLATGSPGSYHLIPDTFHRPLRQTAAVLRRGKEPALAKQFIAFVKGREGQSIMRRYGFTLPSRGGA